MIRGADSLKGNKSVNISDRDLPVSLRTFIVCSTSGLLVKDKDPWKINCSKHGSGSGFELFYLTPPRLQLPKFKLCLMVWALSWASNCNPAKHSLRNVSSFIPGSEKRTNWTRSSGYFCNFGCVSIAANSPSSTGRANFACVDLLGETGGQDEPSPQVCLRPHFSDLS